MTRDCQGALVRTALAAVQPLTQTGTWLSAGTQPPPQWAPGAGSTGALEVLLISPMRPTRPASLHIPGPAIPPKHTVPLCQADGGHRSVGVPPRDETQEAGDLFPGEWNLY